MAYDERLVDKVREALAHRNDVSEKKMFQGVCFMVNDKMCVCVRDNELMCRLSPADAEGELENGNCREMIHHGKAMKGYIFVNELGYKNQKDFSRLIGLCLEFNAVAKASKRRKTK